MIKLDNASVSNILDEYVKGKQKKADISVELDNVNDLDPLVLLRVMSNEPDVETLSPVIELLLDGHTITFKIGEETVKSVIYNRGSGNRLHLMFNGEPYLYDILVQFCYALLLKKLTPHLEGSN